MNGKPCPDKCNEAYRIQDCMWESADCGHGADEKELNALVKRIQKALALS